MLSPPFTDAAALQLIREPKPITKAVVRTTLVPNQLSTRSTSRQGCYSTRGRSGREFRLIVRENIRIPGNFSVILATVVGGKTLRLVRCQGGHQPHTNHIELAAGQGVTGIPWNTCHIHRYTERYWLVDPRKHDEYAEPTTEYTTWQNALQFLVNLGNFEFSDDCGNALHPLFPDKI